MKEEDLDRLLSGYRQIAFACGGCVLLFGFVRAMYQPIGVDPILVRIAVASACFVYVAMSYTKYVRQRPFSTIAIIAAIVCGFVVYLAYLNRFEAASCFIVLTTTMMCSLVLRTTRALVIFFSGAISCIGIFLALTPEPEVGPIFFLATLLILCIFTYFNQKMRIETEQSLREATELAEQAASSQRRFLANMSHEIRTPMNGVIGMTQILQRTHLNTEQKELTNTIELSSEMLLSIINNVLEFSKIEANQIKLEHIAFDIREHLVDTLKLLATSAERKGLTLDFDSGPDLPPALRGDPHRLRQILVNLVNNAIKFTSEGKVTVQVCGRNDGPGYRLTCRVIDSGIGISEAAQATLFSEFTQADSSTTREFGGTGLGLAITQNLVELMGGEIAVQSAPGAGSTFTVTIPFALASNEEFPAGAAENSRQASMQNSVKNGALKILLAEDNAVNQKVVTKMLQNLGFATDIAENGKVALEAVRNIEYDLVLMDIQMPEMDGIEATRRIRQELPGHPCRIVAVTANAFEEDRAACMAAGMNDYLAKPIQRSELDATIKRVFPERA